MGTTQASFADVLEVLSIAILIDGVIHPREPEEFVSQVRVLRVFADDGPQFSALAATKWFDANWQRILDELSSGNRNEFLRKALLRIDEEWLGPLVYASMGQICRSDNEFHPTEKDLLKYAASVWNL